MLRKQGMRARNFCCFYCFLAIAFHLLPDCAQDLISSFLEVATEDSQILCVQGRVAISLCLWGFIRRAKQAFEELWQRRDEIEFMEWDWIAGNSHISPVTTLTGTVAMGTSHRVTTGGGTTSPSQPYIEKHDRT